jgi:hypothetical protein
MHGHISSKKFVSNTKQIQSNGREHPYIGPRRRCEDKVLRLFVNRCTAQSATR